MTATILTKRIFPKVATTLQYDTISFRVEGDRSNLGR